MTGSDARVARGRAGRSELDLRAAANRGREWRSADSGIRDEQRDQVDDEGGDAEVGERPEGRPRTWVRKLDLQARGRALARPRLQSSDGSTHVQFGYTFGE